MNVVYRITAVVLDTTILSYNPVLLRHRTVSGKLAIFNEIVQFYRTICGNVALAREWGGFRTFYFDLTRIIYT